MAGVTQRVPSVGSVRLVLALIVGLSVGTAGSVVRASGPAGPTIRAASEPFLAGPPVDLFKKARDLAPGGVLLCALLGVLVAVRHLSGSDANAHLDWPRTTIDGLEAGIWVVDTAGRTVLVNQAMARIVGSNLESLRSRSREEFVAVPAGRDGRVGEILVRRADGSSTRKLLTVNTLRDEAGTPIGSAARLESPRSNDSLLTVSLIEAVPLPAWVVDPSDGSIVAVNEAAVLLYGYARDEFRVLRVGELEDGPSPAHGSPFDGRKRHRRRDGSTIDVEIRSSTWSGGHRTFRVVQAFEVSGSVSERETVADRGRDEFLASLSHELRTPLTPVLVQIGALLRDHQTPPSIRPSLELTRRNIELEARLIDDLLDVTKLRRRELKLQRESVDLHALIAQVVEICRDDIASRSLHLEQELTADRSTIDADPTRMRQVVWNLVRNSVKFSDEGGHVLLRTRNPEGDPDRIVLEVTDRGVGIAPPDLDRIFEVFERGSFREGRRFGGLGLGLTISKALVEAHGGKLTAYSAGRDQGATFTVDLAILSKPPVPTGGSRPSSTAPAVGSAPRRLLLVEDSLDTLRVLDRLLRHRGFRVVTASSVATAIEAAAANPLDLLISDIGLPDGSGLDIKRRLPGLPGIAISGYVTDEDRQRSEQAGFSAHLSKPLDFELLLETIERVIQQDGATRR